MNCFRRRGFCLLPLDRFRRHLGEANSIVIRKTAEDSLVPFVPSSPQLVAARRILAKPVLSHAVSSFLDRLRLHLCVRNVSLPLPISSSQPRLRPSLTALMTPPPDRSSCQGRFPGEAFGLSLDRRDELQAEAGSFGVP
jgi:hypothetical protein